MNLNRVIILFCTVTSQRERVYNKIELKEREEHMLANLTNMSYIVYNKIE